MTEKPTPAVIYGVKSSLDEKESVADQHRLVLAAIEKEGGRQVIAEPFGEANASGYRKERGQELEAAMTTAVDAANEHGEAELWVWHSSRLARGDGTKGKRSIQLVVAQLLYENVIVRSVSDPEMVTPMLAGIASKVSNQYSADLSAHVRRGLRQRKEAGKPIGGLAFGYRSEPVMVDGKPLMRGQVVVTEWLPDPKTKLVLEDIWTMVEQGLSCGQIGRRLNERGDRTQRGRPWRPVTVRQVVGNDVYLGERGYPALINRARWDRLQELVDPKTPAGAQRRQGGRPVGSNSRPMLLHGLGFCSKCGAPMRVRTDKMLYVCRNKRQGTGLCDARSIPARIADEHVLRHLHVFIGSVEDWITERVQERSTELQAREKTLGRERDRLGELELQREARMGELEDVGITERGLEVIGRIDRKIGAQQQKIREAEAMTAEWDSPPDVNAALDYYSKLVDAIRGKVAGTDGVEAVNAALMTVVAGIWLSYDGKRLKASFALRPLSDDPLPGVSGLAQAMSQSMPGKRFPLFLNNNPDEIEQTKKELACMAKPDSQPNPTDSTCAGADRPSRPRTARSPRGP